MSWVSERHLVAAISNAGGFGVIACGAMEPDMLAAEIAGAQALTDRPFGVNLITMHPRLDALIRVCLEAGVGHIVLAGGIPPGGAVRAVKDGGAKLIAFTPALVLAKRLIRSGADALVIEGSEAGGHIGPVSLMVLAQEILPHIREVPVFVAGGLGSWRGDPGICWTWVLPERSSAPASPPPPSRSPTPTSSGPSSGPPRATRCLRCNSTSASR